MSPRHFVLDGIQPADRLTDEEVRDVVALWAERRSGPSQASIADVAEGLDITVEEAEGLLAEVRAARAARQYAIQQEQARLSQELRALSQERDGLAGEEHVLMRLRKQRSEVYQIRVVRQAARARPQPPTPTRSHTGDLAAVMLLCLLASFGMAAVVSASVPH